MIKVLIFFFFWQRCKSANFPSLALFPWLALLLALFTEGEDLRASICAPFSWIAHFQPLAAVTVDRVRVIARKTGKHVKLYSHPGNDLTYRFPLIVEASSRLRARSCIIDGEAVVCGEDGIASFDRIRYRRHDASAFMYAFDLIELDGDDLRRDPLEVRKATLVSLLSRATSGLRFNEHMEHEDGALVFARACKMGLEGIVSKRKDSTYRSGRSPHWIKCKNPACEAVRRQVEEDWGFRKWPSGER